jgi:hypothetical protein
VLELGEDEGWGLRRLKARGYQFDMEDGLLDSLARMAAGYPSMASQLARDTIIAAERNGSTGITRQHLDNAVRNLTVGLQPSAPRPSRGPRLVTPDGRD